MKKITLFLIGALTVFPAFGASSLKVVTTTTDLADLVRQVGGDQVSVECLSLGYQNPHFVETKPSLIVKLMKADMFIQTGLELEIGWAPLLLQSARNKRIQPGAAGFIDASTVIQPLEIPSNPSRAMGDVHPQGNPHYMINPENARKVARLISDRLSDLSPSNKESFQKGLQNFETSLNAKLAEWKPVTDKLKGMPFVSYHKDWTYFAEWLGLKSLGEIEPKPGIPPTASHTADIIAKMKAEKARFIISDPWFENDTGEFIAHETKVPFLILHLFPGAGENENTYLSAMDYNIRTIRDHIQ